MTKTIRMALTVSTGTVDASFGTPQEALTLARMVAAGAQVTQGFSCDLFSYLTGAKLAIAGLSIHGMEGALAMAMDAIANCHGTGKTGNYDVSVPVQFTMDGSRAQLVDAEDWVRGVICAALQKELDAAEAAMSSEGRPVTPTFQFNGDVVSLGSARVDYEV